MGRIGEIITIVFPDNGASKDLNQSLINLIKLYVKRNVSGRKGLYI